MAQDATGTPTSPDNIPTFNVGVDAPTGNGANAMMAQIQSIISGLRVGTAPGGKITPSSALSATGTPSASTYLRGDNSWASISSGPGAPVTTLPASPTDGQQSVLVDSTSSPTYAWLMQYSATASKWIFIGGTPLISETSTAGTAASTTYVTPTTASVSVTAPRTGTYIIEFGYEIQGLTSADCYQWWAAPKLGSLATSDTDSQMVEAVVSGSHALSANRMMKRSLNASDVVVLQHKGVAANSKTIGTQYVSITPVTVT